nr:6657_t:CDS:2 [Entrophospora candida]
MSNNNTRPLIVGQEFPVTPYPVKMKGEVIKGFGRGSKELGIPKANLPEASFEEICKCMEPGIYYGWAQEFYGKELRAIVLGYIRPERDYISVGKLA